MCKKDTLTDLDRNKLTRFLISPNVNLCQASYSDWIGIEIIEDFLYVLAHVGNEEPFQVFNTGLGHIGLVEHA
jgi:hypothetical protein